MLTIIRNNCKKQAFEDHAGITATDAGCVCCAHVQTPSQSVAATCSVEIAESYQPKPEAEHFAELQQLDHRKLLLEVLRGHNLYISI